MNKVKVTDLKDLLPGDLYEYRPNGKWVATLIITELDVPMSKVDPHIRACRFIVEESSSWLTGKIVSLAHDYLNRLIRTGGHIYVHRRS